MADDNEQTKPLLADDNDHVATPTNTTNTTNEHKPHPPQQYGAANSFTVFDKSSDQDAVTAAQAAAFDALFKIESNAVCDAL